MGEALEISKSETGPEMEPEVKKVEEKKVEREIELNEEQRKEIEIYLKYQEEEINQLLRETREQLKLPYEDQIRLEKLCRDPLEKAFQQLEKKTLGDELFRLLKLPGRKEERMEQVSDMYSKLGQVGLIPPEDAKKGRIFFETQRVSYNLEREGLLKRLKRLIEREK